LKAPFVAHERKIRGGREKQLNDDVERVSADSIVGVDGRKR